ncbi:MAG TPA: hypothetical protein VFD90_19905 [Gaiellales bacterium]|jgi:hypothetical protein|nr:hypothetical protein [Gaiellales bacterium]
MPAAVLAGAAMVWQGLFVTSWIGWPVAVSFGAAILLARRDPRLAVAAACLAALCAAWRLLLGWQGLIWFGTSSLVVPSLIAATFALVWRLRPVSA